MAQPECRTCGGAGEWVDSGGNVEVCDDCAGAGAVDYDDLAEAIGAHVEALQRVRPSKHAADADDRAG